MNEKERADRMLNMVNTLTMQAMEVPANERQVFTKREVEAIREDRDRWCTAATVRHPWWRLAGGQAPTGCKFGSQPRASGLALTEEST